MQGHVALHHLGMFDACEVPLLLAALKRRWPILTTVVAGLLWLVNNYNIRGLDGVRLEPKAAAYPGSDAYASSPLGFPAGFPTSFPSGPSLPASSPTPLWPNSNPGTSGNTGFPAASNQLPSTSAPAVGYQAGYPSQVLPPNGSPGQFNQGQYSQGQFGQGQFGQGLPQFGQAQSGPGQLPGALPLPGNFNVDQLRPAARALGPEFEHLLSVGEKLGMLENSRQPAPVSVASNNGSSVGLPGVSSGSQPQRPVTNTLRLASFNLSGWGDSTRDNPAATELILRMLGQFDIVALQDIRSRRDDLLPNLMDRLNSSGRQYDFMIGGRTGRGDRQSQVAFVFDTATVETDRFQLYTVADPEDMLTHEPLVGWFRAKRTDEREAFTFSLVNIHIDSDLAGNELVALPNLIEAVYSDGRGEDDVILAGDFGSTAQLGSILPAATFRTAVDGVATTTRGTALADNFVFPHTSTAEFTGRSGVVDFLRQFNLTLEQAVSVSEHLPVWAEFSIIEGGRPGQVAGTSHSDRN